MTWRAKVLLAEAVVAGEDVEPRCQLEVDLGGGADVAEVEVFEHGFIP